MLCPLTAGYLELSVPAWLYITQSYLCLYLKASTESAPEAAPVGHGSQPSGSQAGGPDSTAKSTAAASEPMGAGLAVRFSSIQGISAIQPASSHAAAAASPWPPPGALSGPGHATVHSSLGPGGGGGGGQLRLVLAVSIRLGGGADRPETQQWVLHFGEAESCTAL